MIIGLKMISFASKICLSGSFDETRCFRFINRIFYVAWLSQSISVAHNFSLIKYV